MGEPTTIAVENCAGCPFSVDDGVEHWCHARDHGVPIDSGLFRLEPPFWCPLRTADRLVTLRKP